MTEPQQPKAAPTPTNTIDNIDEILESIASIGRDWVHDQLVGTSYYKEAIDDIDEVVAEAKAAINKTIMEDITKLIDQPIDIFITNDLPSLLDGGDTASMYYDHFRKKLRQQITKKYGRADNDS